MLAVALWLRLWRVIFLVAMTHTGRFFVPETKSPSERISRHCFKRFCLHIRCRSMRSKRYMRLPKRFDHGICSATSPTFSTTRLARSESLAGVIEFAKSTSSLHTEGILICAQRDRIHSSSMMLNSSQENRYGAVMQAGSRLACPFDLIFSVLSHLLEVLPFFVLIQSFPISSSFGSPLSLSLQYVVVVINDHDEFFNFTILTPRLLPLLFDFGRAKSFKERCRFLGLRRDKSVSNEWSRAAFAREVDSGCGTLWVIRGWWILPNNNV